MFNKFFKKSSSPEVSQGQEINKEVETPHHSILEIRSVLSRYSNLLINRKISGLLDEIPINLNDEFDLAKKEVEAMDFNELLDQLILTSYDQELKFDPKLSPHEFSMLFSTVFNHSDLSPFTSKDQQERNTKLDEAYLQILIVIQKIQGWLEDDKLRLMVERDLVKSNLTYATMYQCLTAFCMVSLGCDQRGRYNIVFSLDYRINEMISRDFASTLIRRIYQLTSDELEFSVYFESLGADCLTAIQSFEGKPSTDNLRVSRTLLHYIT